MEKENGNNWNPAVLGVRDLLFLFWCRRRRAGLLGLPGMWTYGKYKEILWRMRKGSALDHIRFLGLPKVREKREYRKLLC